MKKKQSIKNSIPNFIEVHSDINNSPQKARNNKTKNETSEKNPVRLNADYKMQ